jgi:hypothetical protein
MISGKKDNNRLIIYTIKNMNGKIVETTGYSAVLQNNV